MQPMVVLPTKQAFAENLKSALLAFGVEEKDCARWLEKEFDVSYESARKWLSGQSIPKTDRLVQICRKLGTDINTILGLPSASGSLKQPVGYRALINEIMELSDKEQRIIRTLVRHMIDSHDVDPH